MQFFADSDQPFNTLYVNGENKVVYCHKCQAFHVYFGIISFDIRRPGLEKLIAHLEEKFNVYQHRLASDRKIIRIDTPCRGLRLQLSIFDLEEMLEMLQYALEQYELARWKPNYN
ncbi:MAG: DUF6686 family protein [Bacteroidota bacterium]